MGLLRLRYLHVLVLVLGFLAAGRTGIAHRPLQKENGRLVVSVTWGDVDNTPAKDVYIEAYGFVREYGSDKSFVLKSSQAGRYETSLPAGVYDVFVSDGVSIPRCKRVRIRSDLTSTWTLKLEMDEVYTEH